ncbi:MAG: AAA family ATPase [candidate division WOR-3 bacterium]|nr:AAA family ATPase [candidate division WOR-3 bacterium]
MFRVDYPTKVYESQGVRRLTREIRNLLANPGATLVVLGDIGAGKTTAAFHALGPAEQDGSEIIWVQHPDREHLGISTIMSAIIRSLGEAPRRDIDVRTEQLRRLLGTKSQDHSICLVVDDAHALPRATLRAFKRLLELNFGLRKGLFSLCLIGTYELEAKLTTIPEKFWRCRFFELKPLTQEEAKNYIQWVAQWGSIPLEESSIIYLARQTQNPLALASFVSSLQDHAERLGEKKISIEMTKTYTSNILRRHIEFSNFSQREIATHLGWSVTKTNRVLKGDYPNASEAQQQIIQKLAALREKKTEMAGAK